MLSPMSAAAAETGWMCEGGGTLLVSRMPSSHPGQFCHTEFNGKPKPVSMSNVIDSIHHNGTSTPLQLGDLTGISLRDTQIHLVHG